MLIQGAINIFRQFISLCGMVYSAKNEQFTINQ